MITSLIQCIRKYVENQESADCVLHNLTRKYRLGKSIDPAQTLAFSFPDSSYFMKDILHLRSFTLNILVMTMLVISFLTSVPDHIG